MESSLQGTQEYVYVWIGYRVTHRETAFVYVNRLIDSKNNINVEVNALEIINTYEIWPIAKFLFRGPQVNVL